PQPDLLLLDEPFSSLDAELRVRVRADLVRLLDDLRITTIFVTHDQEEAFVVGEQVAVMNGGRILQQGTPTELYENPITEWLARFVGEANLVPADSHRDGARTAFGVLPTQQPLVAQGLVLVRPEYLTLVAGDDATVGAVEFYGHDTSYQVDGLGPPLMVRELCAPRHRVGDRVGVAYAGGPAVVYPMGESALETDAALA
ncbi:MAG: ABC transporter ATP-binding protein, partial [Actinomycetota bacterium]|nr:ABC transporter ATP-binding protein [Actinomycetota bacterium]